MADIVTSPVEPIVVEHAELAQAVYDPSKQQVGDWTRLSDADLRKEGIKPELIRNDSVGYKAAIYKPQIEALK